MYLTNEKEFSLLWAVAMSFFLADAPATWSGAVAVLGPGAPAAVDGFGVVPGDPHALALLAVLKHGNTC